MSHPKTEGFRFLEHTSDVIIEAWGPTLETAFVHTAEAFYETMLNARTVEAIFEEQVKVQGHDEKELLYNWLEALLLKFEIERMVYSRFHINPISDKTSILSLQAKIKGEKYAPQKHGAKVEIKGITYHLMRIDKQQSGTTVQILLDL
jgi:SHS2 domain-containing protein